MRTISYSLFLNLMIAIDEHTKCKYTKKRISKMIFNHYIKDGPFFVYNSWGTKAYYCAQCQEKDFIKFMELIKKPSKHAKTDSKG